MRTVAKNFIQRWRPSACPIQHGAWSVNAEGVINAPIGYDSLYGRCNVSIRGRGCGMAVSMSREATLMLYPDDALSAWYLEPQGMGDAWRIIAETTSERWRKHHHTSARVDYLALVFDPAVAEAIVQAHNAALAPRHTQKRSAVWRGVC